MKSIKKQLRGNFKFALQIISYLDLHSLILPGSMEAARSCYQFLWQDTALKHVGTYTGSYIMILLQQAIFHFWHTP